MSSKLSWHFYGDPSDGIADLQRSRAKIAKLIDWESEISIAQLKGVVPFVVYRKVMDANYDSISPVAFADSIPGKLYHLGVVFEGVNEPIISDDEHPENAIVKAKRLNDWQVQFANVMHSRGERVAAFSFSTGNPPLNLVPYLVDACRASDYLAFHEYIKPGPDFTQIGRYKDFLNALPADARRQVIITEHGCDSGGTKESGYKGPNWNLNSLQYLQLLSQSDMLYTADDWCVGALIFTFGGGWDSFEIRPMSKQLSVYIASMGGGVIPVVSTTPVPAPVPTPTPTPTPIPPTPVPDPIPNALAQGVDVSHYQGAIDFAALSKNASFVFIKATDGAAGTDNLFSQNWAAAKNAKLLRGAYHYFRNAQDPLLQANHFLQVVGNDLGELPLVLDYEDTESPPNTDNAKIFLDKVQSVTQQAPIIYTGAWYWNRQRFAPVEWAKNYPLWCAHYTSAANPIIPADWSNWTFWQYSDKGVGTDYGMAAKIVVDLDKFNGVLSDLQRFAQTHTPTLVSSPTPPTPAPSDAHWDPRLSALGVGLVRSTATKKYSLVDAQYQDENHSNGNHNVYFTVLDAQNKPQPNVEVFVDWINRSKSDAIGRAVTESNGKANIPLYANLDITKKDGPYFAYVANRDRSDIVTGLGLPEHRHVNFLLTYSLGGSNVPVVPPPTPPPPPIVVPPIPPPVPVGGTTSPLDARLAKYPRPMNDNGIGMCFRQDVAMTTNKPYVDEGVTWLQQLHCTWTLLMVTDWLQAAKAAQKIYNVGIMPVTRLICKIDKNFIAWEDGVKALASQNIPAYIQIFNEPGDDREWNKKPSLARFGSNWANAAVRVFDVGGYPGLQVLGQDEFLAAVNAVRSANRMDIFQKTFFCLHNYGSNHPANYPYDVVNQLGVPVSQAEYDARQKSDGPYSLPFAELNAKRKADAHPGATIFADDTSVLRFLEYKQWMTDALGYCLPMLGGEGGWEFGVEEDLRYAKLSSDEHASNHVELFTQMQTGILSNQQLLPDELFSFAPWILGDGGADSWFNGPLGVKQKTIDAVSAIPSFVRLFGRT